MMLFKKGFWGAIYIYYSCLPLLYSNKDLISLNVRDVSNGSSLSTVRSIIARFFLL